MILFRPVLSVLAYLYIALAVTMLIPAVFDLTAELPGWRIFMMSALCIGGFGILLAVSMRGSLDSGLNTRQTFVLTSLAWASLSVLGAVPFMLYDMTPADAVFESVSGLTTTGSTVLSGLSDLPPGLLIWRSLLQWIGGVGIIVMAIVLLPFLRIGGMQLFQAESSDRSEKIVGRSVELIRLIGTSYVFLTISCVIAYWFCGLDMFDAVNHALTTISTGGYSTHDASFGHFADTPAPWIACLFMVIGALPFVLIIQAARGRPLHLLRDPQVRAFIRIVLYAAVCVTLYRLVSRDAELWNALRDSLFNVISIITGTGYALGDYTGWGRPVVVLGLLLMFVGGCTGSTTGGIKIFRFLVFFGAVNAHLKKMVRPNRVVRENYAGTRLTGEFSFSVLSFLVVYLTSVAIFALVLSLFDLDLVTALSGAATAIGNVGPGIGPVIGPSGNFSGLADGAKWVLSFAMLLGRLELFTVIVLLDPDFWLR